MANCAAPGLYFLKLKPSGLVGWSGEPITGLIAVAVDRGASTARLEVDLGWSSCGLWYADQSKCQQDDLQIERLSGQIVDASGAAIPKAKILLFDSADRLLEQLESDTAGKFASPHSLTGTYQLVVSSAGFTPLRRTVHAELMGDSKRVLAPTVRLGVTGSCTSIDAQ